ncbi:hypothetical protein MYCTH_2070109, partial [Thermothelomyces thermophilus ATCC 42464]
PEGGTLGGGELTVPAAESYGLGPRSEQNPYSGELAATERALGSLPTLRSSRIEISTRNKAAVLTLRQPRKQSGQHHICHIYESIRESTTQEREHSSLLAIPSIRWRS